MKSVTTHHGLHFALPAIAVIIFASAMVVTIAERNAHGSTIDNLGDGLWWAVVTVATVGYGDISPVTPIGRGIAVFLMLAGIGLIGILTATVASYFVGQKTDRSEAERDELRQFVAGELAAYKAPRIVVVVPNIGRSPSGKVDYARLNRVAKETVERSGGDTSKTLLADES